MKVRLYEIAQNYKKTLFLPLVTLNGLFAQVNKKQWEDHDDLSSGTYLPDHESKSLPRLDLFFDYYLTFTTIDLTRTITI